MLKAVPSNIIKIYRNFSLFYYLYMKNEFCFFSSPNGNEELFKDCLYKYNIKKLYQVSWNDQY